MTFLPLIPKGKVIKKSAHPSGAGQMQILSQSS